WEGIKLSSALPRLLDTSARINRIIGGAKCPENTHPWLVLLYYFDEYYCSGTLLNEEWVVTAAHCYMRLGEHDVDAYTGNEVFSTAVDIIEHPNFTSHSNVYENDIMLLKLDPPVVFTSYVSPLSLATCSADVGTVCTVMGWGTTTTPEVPHCVDVNIISNEVCQAAYENNIIDNMVCAGVMEGGKDSCQGDSGGPLVCNGQLQGIVSWGEHPCAQPGKPGVYTDICKYLSWIKETMETPRRGSLVPLEPEC
uniref:Peptidase S1 domain-containing protein n=1 Tax=Sphenodon punctatus TaxID=8508 RepID=A0A8D0GVC9_SPHPU